MYFIGSADLTEDFRRLRRPATCGVNYETGFQTRRVRFLLFLTRSETTERILCLGPGSH